eukprot:gene20118-26847_t
MSDSLLGACPGLTVSRAASGACPGTTPTLFQGANPGGAPPSAGQIIFHFVLTLKQIHVDA